MIDTDRAEFTRRRNEGLKLRHAKRLARWEGIDNWMTRWEQANDPGSRYGAYGKDPATVVVNIKEAS